MKKLFKIIGLSFLSIFLLLLILPFFFKGRILKEVVGMANESLNAKFTLNDVSLSFIKDFPDVSIALEGIDLEGIEAFEGIHLVKIESLKLRVDFWSVFGDEMNIKEIGIESPEINVLVLADGKANYDIAKETAADSLETTAPEELDAPMKWLLQSYYLNNAHISYIDESMPFSMSMQGLNHRGSGDFGASLFTLSTHTDMAVLDMDYDGMTIFKKVVATLEADLEMNMDEMYFGFKENKVMLNQLALALDGWIKMPADDIDMDLRFSSPQSDFKHLFSIIPAEFATDLEGVDIKGDFAFAGFLAGTYNDNSMPGFGMSLDIDKGQVQYPDLPAAIKNIQLKANIDATDGNDYDKMKVDVDKFHIEMAGNPVDATLKLRTPVSDAYMKAGIKANIDFDKIKQVLPIEGNDIIHGLLLADVMLDGHMSAIEQERYADFKADGSVELQKFSYHSDSLPFDTEIASARLNFTPKYLDLVDFQSKFGDSDIALKGKISNYLAYALQDEMLEGNLDMHAKYMNLNTFMGESTEGPASDTAESTVSTETNADSSGVLLIPGNINFILDSKIETLLYDDLSIKNVQGQVRIKDEVMSLQQLKMELFGGAINMSGSYNTQDHENPKADFHYQIQHMEIAPTAEAFVTIEKLAPIASSCRGNFSTSMDLALLLDKQMNPVMESILGAGDLQTASVSVEKFAPIAEAAKSLGLKGVDSQSFKDVKLSFKIEDGKVQVAPFTVKVDGIETKVAGYTTLDGQMDYSMNMDLPFEKISGQLTQQANSLIKDLNAKLGTQISAGDKIPVRVRLTGAIDKPKVSLDYGDLLQNSAKDVKEAVKVEIEKKVEEIKEDALEKAKVEADKIIADAQKKVDQLMAQAKKTAEDARKLGYDEAQKIEKSAANPLEKAAKKLAADQMRKETDKQVNKGLSEAQKQADGIMAQARKEADDVLAKAGAK